MVDFKAINIQFTHIATGEHVEFIAWITDFSDSYTSNWNSQELYGRMDPMMTFKNTSRKMTLAWDVVAGSYEEARSNMSKISKFIQMQYPTYAKGTGARGGGGASMIGAPPLIRASFANWVGSSMDGSLGFGGTGGLVCALAGVTFKPNMEHGTFGDGNGIYPQSFALSVEMTVLHEHPLGYHEGNENKFGNSEGQEDKFPYGSDIKEATKTFNAPDKPSTSKKNPKSGVKTNSDDAANKALITGGK